RHKRIWHDDERKHANTSLFLRRIGERKQDKVGEEIQEDERQVCLVIHKSRKWHTSVRLEAGNTHSDETWIRGPNVKLPLKS
ncbi:hypothetical protein M408DRAFT_333308, partial [Serendipita vermifera MAFF 305830]